MWITLIPFIQVIQFELLAVMITCFWYGAHGYNYIAWRKCQKLDWYWE